MISVSINKYMKNQEYYHQMIKDNNEGILLKKGKDEYVLVSKKQYKEMMRKIHNAEYMEMIDESLQQLEEGKVVYKTMEELRAMENG